MQTLNERSKQILSQVVERYVATGEPVGSKTLAQHQDLNVSPATIRNVLADLERQGLLYAPHTSAGRMPTEAGLRFFVHGVLEVGAVPEAEAHKLTERCNTNNRNYPTLLQQTTDALAGLAGCAGLVLAPKAEEPLKHIEFVRLDSGAVLVVLVLANGTVENRVLQNMDHLPAHTLIEASNYLNTKLAGKTLEEGRNLIHKELATQQATLDTLTSKLVQQGLAGWGGGDDQALIVRGQSHLLKDVTESEDIERVQRLFTALETEQTFMQLLDATKASDGMQIFIGAENDLFDVSGCAAIIAPFKQENRVVGAIGVVGPTRLNYGRVIPMVDFTAQLIGKMLGQQS